PRPGAFLCRCRHSNFGVRLFHRGRHLHAACSTPQDGVRRTITFDQIVVTYMFDRKVRLLLLEAIQQVEIALRTHWAQMLTETYGAHSYLDASLFKNSSMYTACLGSLDDELQRSKETFVQHYHSKYTKPSRPPTWAIGELLTLGQLSKWLNNLKHRRDRQAIAHRLGLDEVVVCAFAHHLTHIRNLCAHHCRVWNRKLTFTMTLPNRPASLASQFNEQQDRRIYNTLVMLSWCTRIIDPDGTWSARMKELLATRNDEEIRAMGAPANWSNAQPWA
ncbi:Abi family protein, partial [Polaromonas sp. C04]|uniref:Abi family protein n=1 Tax=Polaromonas sp. C04 TaxID=1945857 RepID=UPI00118549AA